MSAIVPAILEKTHEAIEEKLAQLEGLVDSVQIDVVDGAFASPPTWPHTTSSQELTDMASAGDMLHDGSDFRFEADLMVSDPESVADDWVAVGVSRLTIHAASVPDLAALFKKLASHFGHEKDFAPGMLSLGVAFSMEDDLKTIDPLMDQIDYVQFMGIDHIGRQGEPFDTRVLEHIRTFRSRYPHVPIQVDGGASLETAPALLSAGVSRLIMGSGIWTAPDVATRIHELEDLVTRYGRYEES